MYDVGIIGAGPAGIAAAIYAHRYGLKVGLFDKNFGGSIANAPKIGNYPGFVSISGVDLVARFREQIDALKIEYFPVKVKNITKKDDTFEISAGKTHYQAKTIILALGMKRRKLKVPGEKKFGKKGIAYCVTCDAPLFAGKTVIVVGGGNAGVAGAVALSNIAKKVYLIEMQPRLLADQARIDDLAKTKTEIILGNSITEIRGKNFVESIALAKPYQGQKELKINGVFVEIGSEPRRQLAKKLGLQTDEKDFIKIDAAGKTNLAGIFAAGDITTGSNYFWQSTTAIAEGAIVANSCFKYLKGG